MSDPLKHSLNSPSSLRRRELCPASYSLEKGLPEETSEVAADGTTQHAITAAILNADSITESIAKQLAELDQGQSDAVLWCVERAKELMWPGARIVTEHYLDLRWFHPSIEGGTADLIIVEDFVKAVVVDFKFGRTWVQSAAENIQLASYAAGVRKEFDVDQVSACILQPMRERVDLAAPLPKTFERARDAAAKALNPDAQPVAGEEQCQYCRAKGRCPAQLALVEQSKNLPVITKDAVAALPMKTISEFLATWDDRDIDSIVGAMRERLFQAGLVGYTDERWKMGKGRGSRQFRDSAEAKLRELCEGRGVSADQLYSAPKLISVAQAEALLGKSKAVRDVMDVMVIKLEGKPKLERIATDAQNQIHG